MRAVKSICLYLFWEGIINQLIMGDDFFGPGPAEATGDPSFEWNGLLHLWRQLEGKLKLVVDAGTGSELSFPDNGSVVQHCFEPSLTSYDRLVHFRRDHVHVHKLGLSAKEQKAVPFYTHGDTLHHRAVLSCKADCDCQIKVDLTTLDLFMAKDIALSTVNVDLLNVAVSGHEEKVLLGASETLKRTKLVLFEYGSTYKDSSSTLQEVFKILASSHFTLVCRVTPSKLVPIINISGENEDGVLRYYLAAKSKADLLSLLTLYKSPRSMDDIKFGQRFLHVATLPALHSREFLTPGFNLALTNSNSNGNSNSNNGNNNIICKEGGFAGLIRRTRNPNGTWGNRLDHRNEERKYPETESYYTLLELDKTFKVVKETELKDISSRVRHRSYSTGVEDCRFASDSCVLATTLDTNPHWKAEVSVAHFSPRSAEILSVAPVKIKNFLSGTEKNWLPLRCWQNELHVLHFCNPLRILRIDLKTAEAEVIKESPSSSLNIKAHGGAAVQLPDGTFLVTVREYRRAHYACSRWLRLDDQYELIGVSPPTRFQNKYYYEMCMSLTVLPNSNHIVAAVSLEDKVQFVFTFLLDTILRSLTKPK